VLHARVDLLDGESPYVRLGDAFAWGCVLVAALGAVGARRRTA
jgi:apolipoprotein N-acyltransferase